MSALVVCDYCFPEDDKDGILWVPAIVKVFGVTLDGKPVRHYANAGGEGGPKDACAVHLSPAVIEVFNVVSNLENFSHVRIDKIVRDDG